MPQPGRPYPVSIWNSRISGEPSLGELLGDDSLQKLMQRDGVSLSALLDLIVQVRPKQATLFQEPEHGLRLAA